MTSRGSSCAAGVSHQPEREREREERERRWGERERPSGTEWGLPQDTRVPLLDLSYQQQAALLTASDYLSSFPHLWIFCSLHIQQQLQSPTPLTFAHLGFFSVFCVFLLLMRALSKPERATHQPTGPIYFKALVTFIDSVRGFQDRVYWL